MKIFNCTQCHHPVFFENVQCLNCGAVLAFLPDQLTVAAMQADLSQPVPAPAEPADASSLQRYWPVAPDAQVPGDVTYRMCLNRVRYKVCTFAVREDDPEPLCVSCRQTRMLPDLSVPGNLERWAAIEVAKRRLFYTLARLGLARSEAGVGFTEGPVYEFLADVPGQPRVMTGHNEGVITLNVAEADDDERVRRRIALHEPYRTLLGHLRHESGHYYWDRLIWDGGRVEAFRAVFGDERDDYDAALERHYAAGHGNDSAWQQQHVSAYAAAHPWEDWAETWAHYLHMVDLLETAAAYHTSVTVPGAEVPLPDGQVTNPFESPVTDFDELVRQWVPVTLMLNSLNRSLGQADAYPFALSAGALAKLRFVHDVIHAATRKPVLDDPDGGSHKVESATGDGAAATDALQSTQPDAGLGAPAAAPPIGT